MEKLKDITEIIINKQRKLIKQNDLLNAINTQRTKTEKLVNEKAKEATNALVMLQTLVYLRDGVEDISDEQETILTTDSTELNDKIRSVGHQLYHAYMDVLPLKEYWLPLDVSSDKDAEDFDMMQRAICGDVATCSHLSEIFEASENFDAATYWVSYF
jgi:hypothetical protein